MKNVPYPELEIRAALEELDPALDALGAAAWLRKRLAPEPARLALELAQLRRRAGSKLEDAAQLLLTRKGLEQATGQQVAHYRAQRIAAWAARRGAQPWVIDGTAGIGGDSLALLQAGLGNLVCNELDPLSAFMLRANLLTQHAGARVIRSHIESGAVGGDALLLDPDRRVLASGGAGLTRQGDPAQWSPSWEACLSLIKRFESACIKLAPGVDVQRLALPDELPRAWQWISMGGELKEATLWTGSLAQDTGEEPGFQLGCGPEQRNVTLLSRDGSLLSHWCAEPTSCEPMDLEAAQGTAWIAEPDPSILQADLVGALAREHELRPLAKDCVYLGGGAQPAAGPMTSYRVRANCPLNKKRVRAMLEAHGIGPLTVKKRGHSASSEELAKRFAGAGSKPGTLIVARLGRAHHAYLVA